MSYTVNVTLCGHFTAYWNKLSFEIVWPQGGYMQCGLESANALQIMVVAAGYQTSYPLISSLADWINNRLSSPEIRDF